MFHRQRFPMSSAIPPERPKRNFVESNIEPQKLDRSWENNSNLTHLRAASVGVER